MPEMESKTADVFAFGMFAVEVFTGKIPFEEQKNEAVVLRISRGDRPDMPENAQAVGLTGEIWKLLESCWQQNPNKRPTMEEIVKRWEKFTKNSNDDSNLFSGCVQITLVIRTSSSAPYSTSYGRPREPQPPAGFTQATSRRRARTMAPRPPPMSEAARPRRSSAAPQFRTENYPPRPISDKSNRLRTTSEFARPGARSEAVHKVPRSDVAQRGINPEAARPQAQPPAPLPSESFFSEGYRSQVLMTAVSEEDTPEKGCGCIIM